MPDLDDLANMTGVTRERMMKIWEEVKENKRKLDACPTPHRFGRVEFQSGRAHYVFCDACGGRMPVHDALTFRRGFAAAGGNPEVVMSERLLITKRGERPPPEQGGVVS